ncbi:DEAD box helicase [Ectocarpus siliculosus]|uniref:DEAD box helicase n=1 Tax=Ectocarpus siliculosus TaxID=2880 RepID=D7FVR7_ECTSI|nr:DEAD box helicase [Ectocarpus siliculosus]|eukprot:CBJ31982.1 DEAD box helicase [Ectocarpus siliculosus]
MMGRGSGGRRDGRGRGRGGGGSFDRSQDDSYGFVDEGGYSGNNYGGGGGYDQGDQARGGRGAERGYGRARGRSGGRGGGRGRRGYFTDGRGGEALDFEGDGFNRGGRNSGPAGGRGRGRGRGRQSFEGGGRQQRGEFGRREGGHGGRAHETGRGEVWGYEDDDDDVVGIRPTRAPADATVRVESSVGPDGEVDDGSLGSRMGPVDREHFYSIKSLPDIGASDLAVSALKSLGVVRPSKIQAISYSAILTGDHCVVADQTGSGKTLAYLAPLVQRLRLEELAEVHGRARPGRPRVLILAPTAELAQQVYGVAQRLSGSVPFRSCCFTGGPGRTFKTQAKLLEEGVDVLVATPGRVATLLEAGVLNLEDCRAVILDEVDVLFMDETFQLAPIGTCAPEDTQFIFVTATLPQSVSDMLKEEFPGTKFLLGPGLHRVAPGVEEVLIDCSGPPGEPRNEETGLARKRDALLSQLERRMALRTLVFCNTIQGCRQVENMLSRASRGGQFETLVYHSAIDPKQAASNMQQFMRSNALSPMVMVCTDRSSRGMDFDRAEVEHVLLYDFPRDPIEYMRRVGRTARAGRKGVVTVLAWGRQVPLVREIMAGNKRGKRLLSLDD